MPSMRRWTTRRAGCWSRRTWRRARVGGDLTELRVKDIDVSTGMAIASNVAVELTPVSTRGRRFLVRDYPKDKGVAPTAHR
jgi:hypothetical protein